MLNYALADPLQIGPLDGARQILSEISQSEIKDLSVRLNLAKSLGLVGEYQKSLEIAEKMPLNIRNPEALLILAVSYLGLGNKTKYEELFPLTKRMAAIKPDTSLKFAARIGTSAIRALSGNKSIKLRSKISAWTFLQSAGRHGNGDKFFWKPPFRRHRIIR